MEHDVYAFEVAQDETLINGEPQTGQSRLLDLEESFNRLPSYAQLHLGDVATGGQAVVFYERNGETGNVTFERTVDTSGLHGWQMRSTRMTADGPRQTQQAAGIATADSDGFMNRHQLLRPGDALLTHTKGDAAHLKTVGSIVSVHLLESRPTPQAEMLIFPVKPTHGIMNRIRDFWAEHKPFAHAA